MNLSVQKKLGSVHVRGGRVLRVAHDHQVTTIGYDDRSDKERLLNDFASDGMAPFKPRTFDQKWETARIGDVAVEIVSRKTLKVLGHAYITGPAINLIRYAGATPPPAHWFVPALAIRIDPTPPSNDYPPVKFVAAMMVVKFVTRADIAVAALTMESKESATACMRGLATAYSYSAHPMDDGSPAAPEATTHLLATVQIEGNRKFRGALHLQPPKAASDYAAQPFFHELVQSADGLVPFDFFGNVPPDLADETSGA